MDGFRVDITGARQAGVRFDQIPDELYAALQTEIESLTERLFALIEEATPKRTGKLKASERIRIFADKQHIKGEVSIAGDFAKAAALEYGAHRATRVRAHAMRLDHVWANRLDAPISALVDAYTRTPNIEAVRFERGPLAAMQGEIIAGLEAAIDKASAGASRG